MMSFLVNLRVRWLSETTKIDAQLLNGYGLKNIWPSYNKGWNNDIPIRNFSLSLSLGITFIH